MANSNLQQWLPTPFTKRSQFWNQFLEALEEEFNNLRSEKIDPLEIYYDIKNNNDIDNLLDVAYGYGFIPDRSIDSSLDFLKFDINSIGFRKKHRTTYLGYEYGFKSIGYLGQVFIYYYNGTKLIRAFDIGLNVSEILSHNYIDPFLFYAVRNYNEIVLGSLSYDMGLTYDSLSLSYDFSSVIKPTRHISVEYYIDKILTVDSIEYLITNDYLDYLDNNSELNRRAVEIPHNGFQLTVFADLSGNFDSIPGGGSAYSMPDLKVKAAVNSIVVQSEPLTDQKTIKLGTGTQAVPFIGSGLSFPSDLDSPVFSAQVVEEEIYDSANYSIIQTTIEANYAEDIIVNTAPTSSLNKQIPFSTSIRKGSLSLSYEISTVPKSASDDGNGNITGDNITSGTINYITGVVNITFDTTIDGEVLATCIRNSLYPESDPNFSLTEITEAGLYNSNGTLIAYATFPPLQYNDTKYMSGFQFIIIKEQDPFVPSSSEYGEAVYGQGVYGA